jgi:hypothetical protein
MLGGGPASSAIVQNIAVERKKLVAVAYNAVLVTG